MYCETRTKPISCLYRKPCKVPIHCDILNPKKGGQSTKRTCWPRTRQPCELTTINPKNCEPTDCELAGREPAWREARTCRAQSANLPAANPLGAILQATWSRRGRDVGATSAPRTWSRRGQDVVETWSRHGRDVVETWARRRRETWALYYYETWAKQGFRPPRAHVFYLMISQKRPRLEPTSLYIEATTSRLRLDHVSTWARRSRDVGAV